MYTDGGVSGFLDFLEACTVVIQLIVPLALYSGSLVYHQFSLNLNDSK